MHPHIPDRQGQGRLPYLHPLDFSQLTFVFDVFSVTDTSLVSDATFPKAEGPEVEVVSGTAPPPLEIDLSAVDTALLSMNWRKLWSDVVCV